MEQKRESDPVADISNELKDAIAEAITDANTKLDALDRRESLGMQHVLNVLVGVGIYSDEGKYRTIEPETQIMGVRSELMKMIAPVARDIKEGTVEIHHPSGNRELDLFPCTVYKAGKIRRYSKEDKMFKDV